MKPGQTINSNFLSYTISTASRHYKKPLLSDNGIMIVVIKIAAQSRQIKTSFDMFVRSTKNVG